jgi:phosphate starvation-inducible PhoH-like protein|tara:strand:+ start:702 stop:1454 length:753 start_codon:yes stop_codon:yes gene_type:complete
MPAQRERLTKKQKRVLRQQGILDTDNKLTPGFAVDKEISPITYNQQYAFDAWEEGSNLMMHGIAGTGKTFVGLYLALKEMMLPDSQYKKVYIVRSIVPTREMGFLPGTQKDKMSVYEAPYYDIATKIFGRGDAYEILKQRNTVEFLSTSFLRGSTFDDCIILVDEVQNMSDQELHTVMTRVGENCRIIFCGDVKQDDLTSERKKEVSGLRTFMKIIERMREFHFIEFGISDIVRSDLVRSYIIERDRQGL